MCLGCIPNTGIYVNAGMHKNYFKAKVFMRKTVSCRNGGGDLM